MTKRTPGNFRAKCSLVRWKPEKKLTPEERREASEKTYPRRFNREANRGKGRTEIAFPACGGFETDDRQAFEEHMRDVHGKKLAGTRQLKRGTGLWRGPKLTQDGKPFEPSELEPGAIVTWRELVPTGETYRDEDLGDQERPVREWVERSGQVWSLAPYPKSVWVVPFELLEGELCVILRQDSHDGGLRYSVTQYTKKHRNAA